MLLIPVRTPQTLTLLLSFLYCTGVPTPFELCEGGGGAPGFVGWLFFFSVCLFVFVSVLPIGAYIQVPPFTCGSLS